MKRDVLKKMTATAVCVALCYVIPIIFHAVGLGSVFCPLHLPVLLCGLLCGWPYGLFCGIAGPLLSSLLTGMPPTPMLVHMLPEIAAYGFFTGLFFRLIRTKSTLANIYLSLIPAMLLGRIIGGVVRAVVLLGQSGTYSLGLWASAYFVETLPGTVLQLTVIPVLAMILIKTGLFPDRKAGGN